MGLLDSIGSFVEEVAPIAIGVAAGIAGGPAAGLEAYQAANTFEGLLNGESKSGAQGASGGDVSSILALLNNPEVQGLLASA